MNNIFKNNNKHINTADIICEGVYVPNRFRNVVLKHLILNYSKNINSISPSLLLAIQGPKGEGKSFMIRKICEYYSIKYIPISGAELCGNLEGDSVKKLISEYESACIEAATNRKFSCIVIDDFHKSLAASNQKNISRTTNSETLVGRIMNLADNPYVHNNRIPIILTGNNFTTLYSPLTRNSRMEIFDWVPEIEEKEKIVFNIFKQYYPNINCEVVEELVNQYKDCYVAFFKSLAQDVFWGDCSSIIEEFHTQRHNIDLDNITDLVVKSISVNEDIGIKNLLYFANERSKNIPKNYE